MNIFLNYLAFCIVYITVGTAILGFLFWAIEKSLNYLKEYFFPTPELPNEILDAIEQDAHDFVWSMHRVGEEPGMGEYYRVYNHLYYKKYIEYFGK